ncbi:MAG: hypothetical protein HYT81_04960 [Gemmatimonadetes bacterium]|nr:hypothetical protein [Gemmatimonadota bacterium]
MTYLRVVGVAAVTVVATILLGWWSVVLVGITSGLISPPGRTTVLEAGGGAALGWAAILAASALGGPIWAVAQRVGPVFGVPGLAFVAITLVFSALLAGSAALVAGELRRPPALRRLGRRKS